MKPRALLRKSLMRPWSLVLAMIAGLSGCADPPPSPTAPLPGPQDYRQMAAWFSERGIVLPSELPAREPTAKAASDHQDEEEEVRHLGDANGNGVLNFWDLWPLWHYLTGFTYLTAHYDFDLLDIDRDGDNDWDDLKYFGEFLYGGTGENPWGIGLPVGPSIRVSLSPDPGETRFTAEGTLWHRFTLQVQTASGDSSDARVRVIANPGELSDLAVEISTASSAPSRSFCAAERNDRTRSLGHGDTVFLAGCLAGESSVLIQDADGDSLRAYSITVVEPSQSSTTDDSFDIELVFVDDFSPGHQALIEEAAEMWETVISEGVRDIDFGVSPFDSDDHDWFERHNWLGRLIIRDEVVDDVRIYVGRLPDDAGVLGTGGPIYVRQGYLPILGFIRFHKDSFTRPLKDIAVHEIAHALGFSTPIWYSLGLVEEDVDPHFKGQGARSAFDVEGGSRYEGKKVPLARDYTHWRESIFGDEVMTPYLDWDNGILSATTLQAMGDIGYRVDASQSDAYTLPGVGKPVATGTRRAVCGASGIGGVGVAPY